MVRDRRRFVEDLGEEGVLLLVLDVVSGLLESRRLALEGGAG